MRAGVLVILAATGCSSVKRRAVIPPPPAAPVAIAVAGPDAGPLQLTVTADGVGPIRADTHVDLASLRGLFPDLTVDAVVRDAAWDHYNAFDVSNHGQHLFDVVPDMDGRPLVDIAAPDLVAPDSIRLPLEQPVEDSSLTCARSKRRFDELHCLRGNLAYVAEGGLPWSGAPDGFVPPPGRLLWWPPSSPGPEGWRYQRAPGLARFSVIVLAQKPQHLLAKIDAKRPVAIMVDTGCEGSDEVHIMRHACGATAAKILSPLLAGLGGQVRHATTDSEIVCTGAQCKVPATSECEANYTLTFAPDGALIGYLERDDWQSQPENQAALDARIAKLLATTATCP
jgi:hypothetical protein